MRKNDIQAVGGRILRMSNEDQQKTNKNDIQAVGGRIVRIHNEDQQKIGGSFVVRNIMCSFVHLFNLYD